MPMKRLKAPLFDIKRDGYVCVCVCLPTLFHCKLPMWMANVHRPNSLRATYCGSISLFLPPSLLAAVTNRPAGRREAALGREGRIMTRWWLCPGFLTAVSLLWAIVWCVCLPVQKVGFSLETFLFAPLSIFPFKKHSSFEQAYLLHISRVPVLSLVKAQRRHFNKIAWLEDISQHFKTCYQWIWHHLRTKW